MRKLASIQTVAALTPIEGKDRIELATILGWRVIVQKGTYAVGDLCVYIEPDSVLPDRPEFDFLRSKKFRIRTMKMAGVLSEGICFPLSILPESVKWIKEGVDVTDALGVVHCDSLADVEQVIFREKRISSPVIRALVSFPLTRPIGRLILKRNTSARKEAEKFPDFISKTDETRIQTRPMLLQNRTRYVCREKLDGSSMTVFLKRKKPRFFWQKETFDFGVCSRNRRLLPGSTDSGRFFYAAEKYKLRKLLESLIANVEWVAVQGELIGPGIQKNPYKLDDYAFYAFNLMTDKGKIPCTIGETILKGFNVPWAPLVGVIETPTTVDSIMEYATGNSALAPTELREGVVCRNYSRNISFKAVSPEYLIARGG